MFIRLFFTIMFVLYTSSGTVSADSNWSAKVSRQSGIEAAVTINQNIQMIQQIAEGEVDPSTVASTIISDTTAALNAYEAYLIWQSNNIQQQINSLTLHLSGAKQILARTPDDQLLEVAEELVKSMDDLKAHKLALIKNANATAKTARAMKVANFGGKTLSVIDTGLKAKTLLNAIQDDADSLAKGIAAAELTNSTALTSFTLAGAKYSKYSSLIGLVYGGTEIAKWYTNLLGDAVRQEADSRTTAIAEEINNADMRIQNRIIALYQSGATPSDDEIRELAKREYASVLDFITGFYDDVGFIESFFGIHKSSMDYINQQYDLALFVLNNRIEDRSIQFSNEIKDRKDLMEGILDQVRITEKILKDSRLDLEFINAVVKPVDVSVIISQVKVGSDTSDKTSEDNTRDNALVVTENDDGEPVLGNNAGTKIEIPSKFTSPLAEEFAAEKARLAELRRQEIARLELERTDQFEIKLTREVQIQNISNELALLEFGDQKEVHNALSLVSSEEQRLRAELNDTVHSAADQQLLEDLLGYREALEDELDRISERILSLESQRDTLQSELTSANALIIANSNQLNALDYDYNQFIEPTTSEKLIDWSDYVYELPAFHQTALISREFSNVIGHSTSKPYDSVVSRQQASLVAEDGTITNDYSEMPDAIREIIDETSEQLTGFSHLFRGGGVDSDGLDSQWIYGNATLPEQYLLRSTNATFKGNLNGFYGHGDLGNYTLYQDGVSGTLTLGMNFATNRLNGSGNIQISTAARAENLSFSLNETKLSVNETSTTRSIGFVAYLNQENTKLTTGEINGTFFGSNSSEAAGTFYFRLADGFTSGTWAAKETLEPSNVGFSNYRGLSAYSFTSNGSSVFGLDFGTIDEITASGDIHFSGTEITHNIESEGANKDPDNYLYEYISWGSWTYANRVIDSIASGNEIRSVDTGSWLVYEPTVNLPTTGTAHYQGHLGTSRIVSYGSSVSDFNPGGTIELNADFGNDRITGSMIVGGGDWTYAEASFDTSIRRGTDSSGFQGELTGDDVDNGLIFGGFAGPNAEEIGGGWQIDHIDGSEAHGFFRAQQ